MKIRWQPGEQLLVRVPLLDEPAVAPEYVIEFTPWIPKMHSERGIFPEPVSSAVLSDDQR
jgi:hypothetical protein